MAQTLNGVTTYFVGNYYEKTGTQITKYYYAGGQRVAMRVDGTLYYLFSDHLGSTSLTTDASGNVVSELRYTAWGAVRHNAGVTPTQYQYTGQYSYTADFGLIYYNARWYDPYLNHMTQPDSIVPDPYNPQDWNRYSYVGNNPVNYIDPTGHMRIQEGNQNDNFSQSLFDEYVEKHTPQPQVLTADPVCSGTNWSVVCKDPTLISSGQVQTPVVYPTYQTPESYDGPYADQACVNPLLCGLLLLADLSTGIQYQSNIPARIGKDYVYANVNYELHSGEFGNYTVVTGLEISNSTVSVLSMRDISFGNTRLQPTTTILIEPNYRVIIPAKFIAGSSIQINLRSPIYNPISLSAVFP